MADDRLLHDENKAVIGQHRPHRDVADSSRSLAQSTRSRHTRRFEIISTDWQPQPTAEPAHRRAARYAWAALLARIYEVFPLVCPLCGAEAVRVTTSRFGPTGNVPSHEKSIGWPRIRRLSAQP
jgi:hypothetical protein